MSETESLTGWWKDAAGRDVKVIHRADQGRVHTFWKDAESCCDERTFAVWRSWGWKRRVEETSP